MSRKAVPGGGGPRATLPTIRPGLAAAPRPPGEALVGLHVVRAARDRAPRFALHWYSEKRRSARADVWDLVGEELRNVPGVSISSHGAPPYTGLPDLGWILRTASLPPDEEIRELNLVHRREESRQVPAVQVRGSGPRYWLLDARSGDVIESYPRK